MAKKVEDKFVGGKIETTNKASKAESSKKDIDIKDRIISPAEVDIDIPVAEAEMPWGLGNIAKGIKALSKGSKVIDGKAGKSVDSVSGSTKGTKDNRKGNPLLPTEGKVGTFKELAKRGTAFDNITPHHMPSAAKMKQAGIKRNNGVSMNMEQPHPGVGGRHRSTYTYGLSGSKLEEYLNLSYRDTLANDILDARRIYMNDGVYTPEIREGLLNTIKKNRDLYPELFNK